MKPFKSKPLTIKSFNKLRPQVHLTSGTVFEIKPKHKYFIILDRENYNPDGLKDLNVALKGFFGKTEFLAILAKDLNSIKLAEIMEGKEG